MPLGFLILSSSWKIVTIGLIKLPCFGRSAIPFELFLKAQRYMDCLESSGRKPPLQIQRSAHNFHDFSDVLSIAEDLQRVIRVLVNTEEEVTALGFIYRSKFSIGTDILHSEVLFFF